MRQVNYNEDIKINLEEKWEQEWWPWLLGISRKELINVIKLVGPGLEKVKNYLSSLR